MSGPLIVAVCLAGAAGAVLRAEVDRLVTGAGRRFPVGILVVNTTGCLLLGIVRGLGLDGDVAVVVAGGLVGSYTTLSTWMVDTHVLARYHDLRAAILNLMSTVSLGLLALGAGWWVAALVH